MLLYCARSLQELRQPLESLGIAHALRDAHHEQFDWTGSCGSFLGLFAKGHVVEELQALAQLVLRGSNWDVDLVAQNDKRHLCKAGLLEEPVELLLCLLKTRAVRCVNQENDAVHSGEIILPD